MSDWRLINFTVGADVERPGLWRDNGEVVDLGPGTTFGASSTLEILSDWDRVLERLERHQPTDAAEILTSGQVRLRAPVPRPGSLFCVGANYRDHMAEMSDREPPDKATADPYVFLKAPQSIVGPGDEILAPVGSEKLDWEAELAVVIGRGGRGIRSSEAYAHVAGYMILNDVTARDRSRPEAWRHWGLDWLSSKSFDGSAPTGPWLTPTHAVPDPMALDIRLYVDDELMQDSSTSEMHFDIAEQIEFLSRDLTLRPGDVIATGTPAGVGRPRGRFLQPGELVTIEIEGLGRLQNPVGQPGTTG